MRLSTSTNLLFGRPDGTRKTLPDTIRALAAAGFAVLDVNFYDWTLPGSPFLSDDWERWTDEVLRTAESVGVSFGQCHGYFYNFFNPGLSEEQRIRHRQLQERSFRCAALLGSHTVVLHPETDESGVAITKRSFDGNRAYFEPMLELFSRLNLRIAFENMCDLSIAPRRKFCAFPEELVDFVDSFGDERVGVCWDFEHADIMRQNQVQAIQYIGERLYATHVSDTHSATDDTLMHVLPMTGGIRWREIMHALKGIGYGGDFSFETHNFTNRLDDAVIPTALKLAHEIGECLLSYAGEMSL